MVNNETIKNSLSEKRNCYCKEEHSGHKENATFSITRDGTVNLDLINLATNRAEKVSTTSRESKWKNAVRTMFSQTRV